jgi:hypothetical protein
MASVQVLFGRFDCMLCALCVYAFNAVGVNFWIKLMKKILNISLERVFYMYLCLNVIISNAFLANYDIPSFTLVYLFSLFFIHLFVLYFAYLSIPIIFKKNNNKQKIVYKKLIKKGY